MTRVLEFIRGSTSHTGALGLDPALGMNCDFIRAAAWVFSPPRALTPVRAESRLARDGWLMILLAVLTGLGTITLLTFGYNTDPWLATLSAIAHGA